MGLLDLPKYVAFKQFVFVYIIMIFCFSDTPVINQLFGVSSGLGMGVFTFDWSQVAYIVSPLVVPWSAQVNVFCCFVFFFWFLSAIFYYTNVSHLTCILRLLR